MKVLLLKNVPKVGKKDEVVTVADGYATNVLFVKKMAVPATDKAIAELQKRQINSATHLKIQSELFEKELDFNLGVHYHNDLNLALPNTIESLPFIIQVQGTINGIGEKTALKPKIK